MRILKRQIQIELSNLSELAISHQELLLMAAKVRGNAQAPYSHFKVGAAVLSETGMMYPGCNFENAGYTQTTHAEQCAIGHMIAHEGPRKIRALAIVGGPAGSKIQIPDVAAKTNRDCTIDDFCFACGQCLAIAWENCLGDVHVPLLMPTIWGEVAKTTIRDAYTMRFGPESLGIDVKRDSK